MPKFQFQVQPTTKPNQNPKSKNSKKKTPKYQNKKESCTHSAAQNHAQDIRNFLKIKKSPSKLAALQPVHLIVSCEDQLTNLGGSDVRERESEVANWDPGL